MTELERQLYVALLGARTIVAATANVNPAALKVKRLIDRATAAYKDQESREVDTTAEAADADGN